MEKTDISLAFGENYFADTAFPIAVRQVRDSSMPRHRYDFTNIPHRHDFVELVFVTGGSGIQQVNGVDYPVVAGDVFLLRGNCEHVFRSGDRISLANVMFDPRRLPLPQQLLRKLPGYHVIFRVEPSLRNRRNFKNRLHLEKHELAGAENLIQRLEHELEERAEGYEAAALGILLELITFVSRRHASQHAGNPAAVVRLGRLISRLERDFAVPWTLARIARQAGTSPNNLLRIFRAATGSSPIDYLVKLRLRHGAELLVDRARPIGEIASACGFRDSNYFSKKFKTLYGVTPRDYRKHLD